MSEQEEEIKATAIETHVYQTKVTGLFGSIIKNQKVITGIIITLSVTLFLAIVGFTVKTVKLPAQEKEILELKAEVLKVIQYQDSDATDKAVQKTEITNLKTSFIDLKTDMKAEFLEIKTMIRANTGIVKQIDKNTK